MLAQGYSTPAATSQRDTRLVNVNGQHRSTFRVSQEKKPVYSQDKCRKQNGETNCGQYVKLMDTLDAIRQIYCYKQKLDS